MDFFHSKTKAHETSEIFREIAEAYEAHGVVARKPELSSGKHKKLLNMTHLVR